MPNGNMEDLWEKVSSIAEHGCAKREGDIQRVTALEGWMSSVEKKVDRVFYTALVTLAGVAAFLLKLLLFSPK